MKRIEQMKKNKWLYVCLGALCFSCTDYQHVSTPQYITASAEKGMIHVTAGQNALQVGYNYRNGMNVFLNGFVRDNTSYVDEFKRYTLSNISIGTGFFLPDLANENTKLHAGIQFGVGAGNLNKDSLHFNSYTANGFIQPIIGMKYKKLFLGFSSLLEYKNYYETTISDKYSTTNESLTYLLNNKNTEALFYEPCFFVQLGSGPVRFQAQYVKTFQLSNIPLVFPENMIYLELNIHFNAFKDLREKEKQLTIKVPRERKHRERRPHYRRKKVEVDQNLKTE